MTRRPTVLTLPLLLAALIILPACESDDTSPVRRRAIRTPDSSLTAQEEYTGPGTLGVPLVTVEFPTKKDEAPQVRTIVGEAQRAAEAATPTTRPATRPATQPTTRPLNPRLPDPK